MEQDPNKPTQNSETGLENEWLWKEAHGDPQLYGLMITKEVIGRQVANRERDLSDARANFTAINEQIALRQQELGISPYTDSAEETPRADE